MTKEQMIALLKSLSVIEGASRATGGRIEEVVADELDLHIELLTELINKGA